VKSSDAHHARLDAGWRPHDVLSDIFAGFATAITPTNLLFVLLGVLLGMFIGVMPGLGPVATIALLLPFTFELEPSTAVIMLAGVYYGTMYGGTITSIMLRVPGETSTVVTMLDGYPMAKQGRAASALGISAIGSLVGGVVAVIGIAFLAPQMADFALNLGPPGITALGILGLVLVSAVSGGSTVKSLAMAFIGVLLATVGIDQFTGTTRLNLGILELRDGLDIVVLAVGLLGIGELINQLTTKDAAPTATTAERSIGTTALPTRADVRQSSGAMARGSVIGFVLGLFPGGGGTLSSLASYGIERRLAKNPEKFGHGAIQGVAGPETANNAAAQSAFVPLLTLGLPTNPVLAVVFGALLLQGITPGPALITQHADVFWGVVASMLVGNIFLVLVNVYLIRVWVKIAHIPLYILAPTAISIVLISVYTVSYSFFDVLLTAFFGLVGYAFLKFGLEAAPLVLGFILGGILENNLRRSLAISGGSLDVFVTDPFSAVVLGLAAILLLGTAWGYIRTRTGHRHTDTTHLLLGVSEEELTEVLAEEAEKPPVEATPRPTAPQVAPVTEKAKEDHNATRP
jgi:putative tricarboxylic transport membrane protein